MDPDRRFEIAIQYAWNWFNYHASQRLRTFHFFLVIVGILVVAYSKALEQDWSIAGGAVALLGALVAVAFWILDIRNEELVNCARAALDQLEPELHVEIRKADRERRYLKKALGDRWFSKRIHPWVMKNQDRRQKIFTHRRWLRRIELILALAFIVATLWAGASYPGVTRANPVPDECGDRVILRLETPCERPVSR